MKRYQESLYQRPPCPHDVVWQHKQVRCMKVAGDAAPDAPVLLCVPSLINRHYILDLTQELSLVHYLAGQGVHVYIIDWAEPCEQDSDADAATYVTDYLLLLISKLVDDHHKPVSLLGYCIGGLLALAATQLAPKNVERLALLATPWDFKAAPAKHSIYDKMQSQLMTGWSPSQPLMSGAYMSWLFYLADPKQYERKYNAFAQLHKESRAYKRFIAVEHWVNDTVPLTRAFALDCLVSWAQRNDTARLAWCVAGEIINPAKVECPVLIAAPRHDRIVPPDTALAITAYWEHPTVIEPDTGHIGMIIGSKRHEALWQPFLTWCHDVL